MGITKIGAYIKFCRTTYRTTPARLAQEFKKKDFSVAQITDRLRPLGLSKTADVLVKMNELSLFLAVMQHEDRGCEGPVYARALMMTLRYRHPQVYQELSQTLRSDVALIDSIVGRDFIF